MSTHAGTSRSSLLENSEETNDHGACRAKQVTLAAAEHTRKRGRDASRRKTQPYRGIATDNPGPRRIDSEYLADARRSLGERGSSERDASPTAACLAGACINKCAGTLGDHGRPRRATRARARTLCLPPVHRPDERRKRIRVTPRQIPRAASRRGSRRRIFLLDEAEGRRGDGLANLPPGLSAAAGISESLTRRTYARMYPGDARPPEINGVGSRRDAFFVNKTRTDARARAAGRRRRMGWRSEPHQLQSAASSDSRSLPQLRAFVRPRLDTARHRRGTRGCFNGW